MIHGFIVESRFSHPVNFLAAVMVWFQSLGLGLMHHRCTRLKRDSKREWNRNWKPYCWNTKLGIPPILLLVWFPLPTHIRHIPLPVPVRLDPHAFDPPKNRLGSTVYLSITDSQSTSISIRLSANMAGNVEFPSHRTYPTSIKHGWTIPELNMEVSGHFPMENFPLPCLIGGCPSSESLSWGPQNSNFTMVYGRYIYTHLYILWFINQRSHHWGGTTTFRGDIPLHSPFIWYLQLFLKWPLIGESPPSYSAPLRQPTAQHGGLFRSAPGVGHRHGSYQGIWTRLRWSDVVWRKW